MGGLRSGAACLLLLLASVVAHPRLATPVHALVCDAPWGSDVAAGARLLLTGQSDLTGHQGFVIGRVVRYLRVPDLRLTVDVAAVIGHEPHRDIEIVVSPNGSQSDFQVGRDYLLPLYRSTDPTIVDLTIHPCGPVVELANTNAMAALLADVPDVLVVDTDLFVGIGEADRNGDGSLHPALLAGSAILLLAAIAGFAFRSRRRLT